MNKIFVKVLKVILQCIKKWRNKVYLIQLLNLKRSKEIELLTLVKRKFLVHNVQIILFLKKRNQILNKKKVEKEGKIFTLLIIKNCIK